MDIKFIFRSLITMVAVPMIGISIYDSYCLISDCKSKMEFKNVALMPIIRNSIYMLFFLGCLFFSFTVKFK